MEQRPASYCANIAGIDEAGRGCLAGPVVACAVILDAPLHGLKDSKQLTEAARERLAPKIRAQAVAWGLGVIWPGTIDRLNILQATFLAMARAVASLKKLPGLLLIDGNQTIPGLVLTSALGQSLPAQKAIVKGDTLIPQISAASILAKTFRDKLMRKLARRWPGYGFEQHKGYPVPAHCAALANLGPSRMHRFSFRGVAAAGSQNG